MRGRSDEQGEGPSEGQKVSAVEHGEAKSLNAVLKGLGLAYAGLIGAMAALVGPVLAQTIPRPEVLWTGDPPGFKGTRGPNDSVYVYVYPAPAGNNNGSALVICPGGAYAGLAIGHEGHAVAAWANTLGMTAFVLKYRLSAGGYRHPIPMWDVQRALRWARAHASRWSLDPKRVGVLGFSAGGHLASTAGTHYDLGKTGSAMRDSVDGQSCRPAFQILVYPVITMDLAYTHRQSRDNILGTNPSQALVDSLSNEKQVTADTPPAFIVHTRDDGVVPFRNADEFHKACLTKGVKTEFRAYANGPHGFGLADGKSGAPNVPAVATWPGFAATWLNSLGVFTPPTALREQTGHRAKSKPAGRTVILRTMAGTDRDAQGRAVDIK
jgi:acetyl esterase/lipase